MSAENPIIPRIFIARSKVITIATELDSPAIEFLDDNAMQNTPVFVFVDKTGVGRWTKRENGVTTIKANCGCTLTKQSCRDIDSGNAFTSITVLGCEALRCWRYEGQRRVSVARGYTSVPEITAFVMHDERFELFRQSLDLGIVFTDKLELGDWATVDLEERDPETAPRASFQESATDTSPSRKRLRTR